MEEIRVIIDGLYIDLFVVMGFYEIDGGFYVCCFILGVESVEVEMIGGKLIGVLECCDYDGFFVGKVDIMY